MKYKTDWISQNDVERQWYVIDVKDQILGRVATQIAELLMGKGKTNYVPNIDCGDNIIVVNASNVKLTRGKELKKFYYTHSGFMGHLKVTRFDEMMKKNPEYIIRQAVKRMLPQNKLMDKRMARVFIYDGAEHKNQAQKPITVKL
jgi:large subunit ribosomal protein L13